MGPFDLIFDAYVGLAVTYYTAVSDLLSIVLLSNVKF